MVRLAANLKLATHRVADEDRTVDQRIEVFGAVGVRRGARSAGSPKPSSQSRARSARHADALSQPPSK